MTAFFCNFEALGSVDVIIRPYQERLLVCTLALSFESSIGKLDRGCWGIYKWRLIRRLTPAFLAARAAVSKVWLAQPLRQSDTDIGVRGSFRHTGSLAQSGIRLEDFLGMKDDVWSSFESDCGQNVGNRSVRGARMKVSKYW